MNDTPHRGTVLVTGGAGYVGAVLVPRLLQEGYVVRVLDLYLYGTEVLDGVRGDPRLTEIKGDIRDRPLVRSAVAGCHSVIHLACISNDPSFELDPTLGRSINYDAFEPLVEESRDAGASRFVYASTSSVYGLSTAKEVDERHPLAPLTDYSKYKAMCETVLARYERPGFATVTVRPATVCGYSPRQRLDLTVNILTNHAVNTGTIRVFGGDQLRPNIHIDDVVDLYLLLLSLPEARVAGRTFNAGYENHSVQNIASMVKRVVEHDLPRRAPIAIERTTTDDMRSYHISSRAIRDALGFAPTRSIERAARDLVAAFQAGKLPDSMTDPRYFNIKKMQQVRLD